MPMKSSFITLQTYLVLFEESVTETSKISCTVVILCLITLLESSTAIHCIVSTSTGVEHNRLVMLPNS